MAYIPDKPKVYRGTPYDRDCSVMVDDGEFTRYLHNVRDNMEGRGTSGFAWGYGGHGPNSLAVSLLHDYFGGYPSEEWPDEWTPRVTPWHHYKSAFYDWFVEPQPMDSSWELTTEQITEWLKTHTPYNFKRWRAYVETRRRIYREAHDKIEAWLDFTETPTPRRRHFRNI